MTTMLQLIQSAAGEMGLAAPTIVVGSADTLTQQYLALLNGLGNELQRGYDWQHSTKAYRFTTQYLTTTGTTTVGSPVITGIPTTVGLDTTYICIGTGVNQDCNILTVDTLTQVTLNQASTASGTVTLNFCKAAYDMPSDYDRPIDRTHWDKSKHWEMLGPETAQQWEWLKSGFIATGPRIRFRILGGQFNIWPPVSTAEYLGFEYVSNAWIYAAGSTTATKSYFTVDTDTCSFPDRLLISGLKMKFAEAKGFDAAPHGRDYLSALSIAKANDGGSQTLSFAPRPSQLLIGWGQIPDTGYGS